MTLPNSITSIGNFAFYHCSGLTSVTMVNEVRPLQLENAYSPIEVTELPMVNEIRPLQRSNDWSPIEVTELGIANENKVTLIQN